MFRVDAFDKLPWEKKPDGRYWTHITLGEVGKELLYNHSAEGKQVEIATEEGLFNDDSVRSLPGLPIVLTHPKNGYALNSDRLRVGTILSTIGREEGKLIAEAIIDDARGVELIDKLLAEGILPEASSGYQLKKLIKRADGKFEQIRGAYDHVAAPLHPGMGRAGKGVGMRFDQVYSDDGTRKYFDFGKRRMSQIVVRLDSTDIILEDPDGKIKEVVDFYSKRFDTAIADLEGVEERLEERQIEIAELKKKNEEIKGENEGLKIRVDSVVLEAEIKLRIDAWDSVKQLIPDVKPDNALTEVEIYKSAIAIIAPDINLDMTDEAIKGLWRGLTINKPVAKKRTDEFLEDNKKRSDTNGKPARAIAYEQAHLNRKK